MEIWDKIRKRWSHEGEDGAVEDLRIEAAEMAESNAEEAAQISDAPGTAETNAEEAAQISDAPGTAETNAEKAAQTSDALETKETNAREAALPLDALEAPEGPPKRRTSDEMIETMLESVTAREQGGAAGGLAAETAEAPTEETAQSRAEEDVPSLAAADTGWEFQTWQTEEEPFEEAETDPADDEEDDFGDALF